MSFPSAVAVGKILPGMKTKISQYYQSHPLKSRAEQSRGGYNKQEKKDESCIVTEDTVILRQMFHRTKHPNSNASYFQS